TGVQTCALPIFHRPAHPQTFGGAQQDRLEGPRPVPAADPDALRADLPGSPHLRVGQCVLAASVWRAFGRGDELFGLDWQKGQGDWSDTLDLQPRREQVRRAGNAKITGTADRAESGGEVDGDR